MPCAQIRHRVFVTKYKLLEVSEGPWNGSLFFVVRGGFVNCAMKYWWFQFWVVWWSGCMNHMFDCFSMTI